MLFEEEDSTLLKKWIVKRLEDISDADSDVLADYVLALLRHDQDASEVQKLCLEQLDDFLRDHTESFVKDVFEAIANKTYLNAASSTLPEVAPSSPAKEAPKEDEDVMKTEETEIPLAPTGDSSSKKRSFAERDDANGPEASPYGRSGTMQRGNKQHRRGMPSGRWTRGDGMNGRGTGRSPNMPFVEAHNPPFPNPATAGIGLAGLLPGLNVPPNPQNLSGQPGFQPWDMAAMMAMAGAWQVPGLQVPGQASTSGSPPQGMALPIKKKGQKCRDYEQQGFCMRGQMCPYEHGEDVITVPEYDKADEYDPNNAQLLNFAPPVNRISTGNGFQPMRGSFRGRGRGGSRGGRNGRSEFSAVGPNTDPTNTTIVIESIPEDKLNETDLREYFSKFGEIKKVTTQSYRRLAIIEFETHDSARVAHASPEPIFNNRFIKVFWYKSSEHTNSSNRMQIQPQTIKAAMGEDTDMADAESKEPEFDMEEFKKKQEEAQKAHEAREAKKKQLEEQKKELEKKRLEVAKMQAEQKALLEKIKEKERAKKGGVEAQNANGAQSPTEGDGSKDAVTAALKAQLEKLEQEAAILGIDPNATDDASAQSSTFYRGRGGFRGAPFRGRGSFRGASVPPYVARGGFRGAARAKAFAAKSLDNRPKRVALKGLSKGDERGQEKLREVLFSVGLTPTIVAAHPSLESTTVVSFPARYLAETFLTKKADLVALTDTPITVEWVPNDVTIPEEVELENKRKNAGLQNNGAGSGGANDTNMGGAGESNGSDGGARDFGRRDDDFEMDVGEEEEGDGWLPE